MPVYCKLECTQCGYKSPLFVLAPWNGIATCQRCEEFVLGERCPFRPLDQERTCSLCDEHVRLHVETDKVTCPKCEVPADIDSGLVFKGPTLPSLLLGMRVHFQRRGVVGGAPMGIVGNQEAILSGDLSENEGIWWGEALVTCLEPLTLKVLFKLSESRVEPERLEIGFPLIGDPWFAVNLKRLYEQSETQPQASRTALRGWAPSGWVNQCGTGKTKLDAIDSSRLIHMLLNLPTHIHCLQEVHDGSSWLPWSEHHLVVCYSRNRQLRIYPNQPPPGSTAIEDCAFHTPFWVDLCRGEERVVRWSQQKLLKRHRRNG